MQSLLLPTPWFPNTHFGPHRFDIDPGRIPNHPRPPSSGPQSGLGVSHPSLPMSGSLPASTQSEAAITSQQQRHLALESTTATDPVHTSLPPRLPSLNPVRAPSVTQAPRFFPPLGAVHGSPSIQIPSVHSGISQTVTGSTPAHGVPATSAVRTLPPRSTRRTKAHVASACVNCKRKHLGCDSARPCRRCVLSGKASTCVDVTHKKRGRPPLKAEENPLRVFSAVEGSLASRDQYQVASARGHGHSRTSSREIRPITDLQFVPPQGHNVTGSSMVLGTTAAHPPRWQPFNTSPPMIAAGRGQRPLASPVLTPYPGSNYQQSPFAPSPGTSFATPAGATELRPILTYGERPSAGSPQTVSPQQYQHHFAPPLPSHMNPPTPKRPQDVAGSVLDVQDPSRDAGFRLPPILPSPTAVAHGSPAHTHRRSGSYPDTTGYQSTTSPLHEFQVQSQLQESPRMLFDSASRLDLRSPFPSIPRPQSMIGSQEGTSPLLQTQQLRRDSGPIEATSERRRKSEADTEDNPQPAKRRRMAVDDIVND